MSKATRLQQCSLFSHVRRDCNSGSRPIFSIPNPGIVDALIPGFRDDEKCKNMAEFYGIFARKIPFPGVLGQFPALKLRVNGFEPTPTT